LLPDDQVVVFSRDEVRGAVERLFRKPAFARAT
jgi:hypothetical protein